MINVLLITNKSDITSDFIVKKLKEKNVIFYRFNTEELTKSVSISLDFKNSSFFLYDNKTDQIVDLKKVKSVYFRRPELPTISTKEINDGEIHFIKNEILFTLEGIYKILKNAYWISPLYSIREAENKIYQLEVAKSLGLNIPNSIISNKKDHIEQFFNANKKNCIIKPIKSGLIEEGNSSVIFTSIINELPSDKSRLECLPHFFQNCIPKQGDVRITMVGSKAFGALIHSQESSTTKIDWRRGEIPLEHSKINIPDNLINKCTLLLKDLNLRFGAIDFILGENGEYIFLEINPNGQWAWIENQTGYEISNEIVNLLINENF